jgi:mannosylglucosylglycerate synthase
MKDTHTAILHYAAPPVVGGVEAVIKAHVGVFLQASYPVTVIAGRGEAEALPARAEFIRVPEVDSQHPQIAKISSRLERGEVPPDFDALSERIAEKLAPLLQRFDNLIVHNIFTKRFNLPLTAALHRLLDENVIENCIAWCHDLGWTSAHSRPKLHPGYPWDLLRTHRPDVTYAVVSRERQRALAELLDRPAEEIRVIHNGVDPALLLGLTDVGQALMERLELLASDLILLMPVRVTQAKNIELALRVTAALKDRALRPKLILTGPPDPHDERSMAYFGELQALRRELGVEGEMRFVFESGPGPDEPYLIDMPVVADLLRVCDVMFMPSHREGFGMPVLEAGLVGVPVVCTEVPAAREIGGEDVTLIDAAGDPTQIAERILALVERSPVHRLRRRVRREYTWRAIFHRHIEPLLEKCRAGFHTRRIPDGAHIPAQIEERITQAERLWLFLDYDGTLADFAPTPEHVSPDPALIELLIKLSRHPRIRTAVISGRRLSHVEKLTPVPGMLLAGTYGIELRLPDGEYVERVAYDEIRPLLEEIKPRWEQLIAGREGFFLEDKDWALAIHAKFAADEEAEEVLSAAREMATEAADAEVFRVLGGHKFLEIGPRLAHKGRTVDYLLESYAWPGALPLYVGDDDKDEEAFGAIQARGGIAIVVSEEPRDTKADGRLEAPRVTRRWLEALPARFSEM